MRAGAGALTLVLLTGCSVTSQAPADNRQDAPRAVVSVFPLDRGKVLASDNSILVSTAGGTLTSVTVQASGRPMAGVFSSDRTQWRSQRPMAPGTTYRVRVVATGPGGAVERTSEFVTKPAVRTFGIAILLPNKDDTGLTVGVGMPIMVTFDQPIKDRVSVERNLLVQASRPIEGAWHWFDDKHVVFRPRTYWPAYTKVRFVARLAGIRGAEGMYGKQDYVREFTIGRSQISVADTRTHHMQIRRDGKLIKNFPISAGSGDVFRHYTTSGIHLAMSREPVTVMTSPDAAPGQPGYYQTTVYNTVRISNSGEYVHSAPWSVGSQGNANVSHGCVNISPANAKWFIDNTLLGDPIIVTGTPRRLEPTNGWSHWQESWRDWLKWSRLRAMVVDPMEPSAAAPRS